MSTQVQRTNNACRNEAAGRPWHAELELACVQAYNDWLIDEWSAASERFIPQCIVPVWPPTS